MWIMSSSQTYIQYGTIGVFKETGIVSFLALLQEDGASQRSRSAKILTFQKAGVGAGHFLCTLLHVGQEQKLEGSERSSL